MDNNPTPTPTPPQPSDEPAPVATFTPTPNAVSPAPVPTAPNGVFTTAVPQPPKKSKKSIIVGSIIAGAILLFGGGGALAYNFWYQNPEKVVHDAVINAFKAKTITGKGSFNVKSDSVSLKVEFDSKGNRTDGLIDAKITMTGEGGDGQNLTVNVAAALLVKGDTFYFKFDNLRETIKDLEPSLGEMATVAEPIINKIDGQWVSVKASDYEDISKETADQQRCITKVFDDLTTNDSMRQEVIDLYKANKILAIDKKLATKSIEGVASLGYEVSVDATATKAFVKGLADTSFGKELQKCDEDVDFADVADDISTDNSDDDSTVQLWVSRFGHEITELNATSKSDDASGSFVFNPIFNKDVEIEAPKDTITLKQLQADIEKAMQEYYSSQYNMYDEYSYEDEMNRYNLN